MLAGVGFLGLFVVLDLAVTWPNYAALIGLSGDWAAATDEEQRAASIAAAEYRRRCSGRPSGLPTPSWSRPWSDFAIGLVMLKGAFGRVTAYVGVATGILGIASVMGPLFWSPLGALADPDVDPDHALAAAGRLRLVTLSWPRS